MSDLKDSAESYFTAFMAKDLEAVAALFAEDIHFWDPNLGNRRGRSVVRDTYEDIFASVGEIRGKVLNVTTEGRTTVVEFTLSLGDDDIVGTDVIDWNERGQIEGLRAYVNPGPGPWSAPA